ncbi:unnamed protein product [Discosporangium mesarthrocarpum]
MGLDWGESAARGAGVGAGREKPETSPPIHLLTDSEGAEGFGAVGTGGAGQNPLVQPVLTATAPPARWRHGERGRKKKGPGGEKQRRVQKQQILSLSPAPSYSSNSLIQQRQQHHQQTQKHHLQCNTSVGVGGSSAAAPGWGLGVAGGAGGWGTGMRIVKGNTRGLHMQAAQSGESLRLERELDQKEREIQMQRSEIHTLREQLRQLGGSRPVGTGVSRGSSRGGGSGRVLTSMSSPSLLVGETLENKLQEGSARNSPPSHHPGSVPVSREALRVAMSRGGEGRAVGAGGGAGWEAPPPGAHPRLVNPERNRGAGTGEGDKDLILSASAMGAPTQDVLVK